MVMTSLNTGITTELQLLPDHHRYSSTGSQLPVLGLSHRNGQGTGTAVPSAPAPGHQWAQGCCPGTPALPCQYLALAHRHSCSNPALQWLQPWLASSFIPGQARGLQCHSLALCPSGPWSCSLLPWLGLPEDVSALGCSYIPKEAVLSASWGCTAITCVIPAESSSQSQHLTPAAPRPGRKVLRDGSAAATSSKVAVPLLGAEPTSAQPWEMLSTPWVLQGSPSCGPRPVLLTQALFCFCFVLLCPGNLPWKPPSYCWTPYTPDASAHSSWCSRALNPLQQILEMKGSRWLFLPQDITLGH